MDSSQFSMVNNEFLNKDSYVVPEKAPLIILDSKSAVFMANNSKETKLTRHITRIMKLVRNSEE